MPSRSYSAGARLGGGGVKKPRLRRVEITFDGDEEATTGPRPHGGYRGSQKHPPGQFSYNRDEAYQQDIEDELIWLADRDYHGQHGSPPWLDDVHREITHSGESPLFVHKLLASGKFEQEQGHIEFQRALLRTGSKKRLSSAPQSGRGQQKQFYRPPRAHRYLSATDLSDVQSGEEALLKYGRPTRTTLLRARNRAGSAPVNAYDIRRESLKRVEDLKNNSLFLSAKEFYNIYATEGETMHSFLTGARYNRAHLLDSRGLEVYGVYMPRENPTGCFMTGTTRARDPGDEIPSAPPDSPRSDIDSPPPPDDSSRSLSYTPYSARPSSSRPTSSRPFTRNTSSRPASSKRSTPISRTQSGWVPLNSASQSVRSAPKTADGGKRDLPEEITMAIPDHINVRGKGGVYVTLKGQKMLEAIEAKLPRVTGVSLPKLKQNRDALEETQFANQPPPTPVDTSQSGDRYKMDHYHTEQLQNYLESTAEEDNGTDYNKVIDKKHPRTPENTYIRHEDSALNGLPVTFQDAEIVGANTKRIQETDTFTKTETYNIDQDRAAVNNDSSQNDKLINGTDRAPSTVVGKVMPTVVSDTKVSITINNGVYTGDGQSDKDDQTVTIKTTQRDDKVIFFMTEEGETKTEQAPVSVTGARDSTDIESVDHIQGTPNGVAKIKIEVPNVDTSIDDHDSNIPISSVDYPFTDNTQQDAQDNDK